MNILPEVKKRFDSLADGYNQRLEVAKFFGHEHMLRVFKERNIGGAKKENLEVLDLGCGTGLCGQAFKPYATFIDGVDLSEKMLANSRRLGIYRHLYLNDILTHLGHLKNQYDLLTSASVFLYFDDLLPVLTNSRFALRPGGIFIFTCDRHDDNSINFQLNPRNTLMFTHSQSYIENCIHTAGLRLITLEKIDERLNWKNQDPVPAFIVLAAA